MNGLTVQARDSAVNGILAVTTQVVHADATAKVDWLKDTPNATCGKGTSFTRANERDSTKTGFSP